MVISTSGARPKFRVCFVSTQALLTQTNFTLPNSLYKKKRKILNLLFHILKRTKKSFTDPKKCVISSLLNPIVKLCSVKINMTKSRSRCFAGALTLLRLSLGQIPLKKLMKSKWTNSGRKTWSLNSKSTKKLANNREIGSWGIWLWLIFQYINWCVIWTGCSRARWRPSQICAG